MKPLSKLKKKVVAADSERPTTERGVSDRAQQADAGQAQGG